MSHLLRYPKVALLGFAMTALLLFAAPASAQNISCSPVTMTNLNFASVNPLSSLTRANATLNYTCTNSSSKQYSATLCFSIGEPGGGPTSPRQMKDSAGDVLQFQLYQKSDYTSVWGSSYFGSITPLTVNITLAGRGSTSAAPSMYGQVVGSQTSAIPTGTTYLDVYQQYDTALTINELKGANAPGTCNTSSTVGYFPFTVSATVTKQCTVTAGSASNINLGSVPSTQTNISGNNTISVSCSNTTPYFIGLSPNSTGFTTGAGTMSGAISGNTDKVPYQLYSNAGLTTMWGNTATSTTVGNGVKGTGTGIAQSITVYAKVTNANFTPDSYSDTVTVNVNY
ncbi:MAG: spore coat U domain-containing protein [Rhodoferax sp.]